MASIGVPDVPRFSNNPEFILLQSDWMVIQQDKLAYPRVVGASYSS